MKDEQQLPAELRRDRIAGLLAERGFVRVTEFAAEFSVSGVTARADLDALVDDGRARRVHGGAMPAVPGLVDRPERETPFEESMSSSSAAKESIGRAAAGLVSSGNSVLLDVGTTALAVARALVARTELNDVTIITNGLNIALELERAIPRFTVIVTGGSLRPLQHSLVSPLAHTVLEQLRADIAFLGCNGVDAEAGVTNINLPEAEVKRLMRASAERVIVIADSAKLGQAHLGRIAPIGDVDLLVTDGGASETLLRPLRDAGVGIEIAS